jgi:very-short-patch-repair endonuclease
MEDLGSTPRELELLRLADAQFGVVHDGQLIRRGLGRKAIQQRVNAGRLTRLHDGVYSWGHSALTREGRWLAALWATSPGSTLSHTTAAAFHDLAREVDAEVHVSTTRSIRSREGIVVHRVRHLDRLDVRPAGLLRVTRIPRTVIDLADVVDWEELRAAVDTLRWFSPAQLRAAQRRAPGRAGRALVERLLEADEAHTKSELERRFLRLVRRHGLPRPDGLNVRVAGLKADCHYREPRVVVELDGRAFHQRRRQMAADRLRDERYQLSGHRVQRLLWDDFHPVVEAATSERVAQMLAGVLPKS